MMNAVNATPKVQNTDNLVQTPAAPPSEGIATVLSKLCCFRYAHATLITVISELSVNAKSISLSERMSEITNRLQTT